MADPGSKKRARFAAYAGLYTVIGLAVLVIANILASRFNKSWDTTTSKRYSLAEQTEKIVSGLKNDLQLLYFDRAENFDRARGLLDRYANLSPKLKVEYYDIDRNKLEAIRSGVVRTGTLLIKADGRQEEAKAVTEQEITGAIARLKSSANQMVCSLEGAGALTLNELSAAKQSLERNNYKTRSVAIDDKAEIPADCTIVFIAGPERNYKEDVTKALKQFVDKGGDMLVLLGPALRSATAQTDENPALVSLLAGWNIEFANNLVLSPRSRHIIGIRDFTQHVIVRELRRYGAVMPLSRSLETKGSAEKLLTTTGDVFGTKVLDADKLNAGGGPSKDMPGPLALAAATTVGSVDAGDIRKQGRVVAVGSVAWVTDDVFYEYGNRDLFLNMFNWLSADEDLISIRPRDPEERRLNVQPGQSWVLYVTSFVPTLAILAAGILVWVKRR
jgi:ABC-type uncharacterized transport system involved in gliding motility auxiliary subunit